MSDVIKGDLNEILKQLAGELAFTNDGINKTVIELRFMVRDSVKSVAKELKSKEVALVDTDIEDLEVACYICTITELLLNNFADFVEKKYSVKH